MKEWNAKEADELFEALWNKKKKNPIRHSSNIWNERAKKWEGGLRNSKTKKERSVRRIEATVDFLTQHGALTPESRVIDIGCGPGRFVAAFAEKAAHVTGTDFSDKMCEFGKNFCEEQGLKNTDFVVCDFKQADIDELKWRGAFDLCAGSITPALSGWDGIQKLMEMSRGWCYNSVFVRVYDPVEEDVITNLFHEEMRHPWSSKSLYAVFNRLWLRGYQPYLDYYEEQDEETVKVDEGLAMRICEHYRPEATESEMNSIVDYLRKRADEDGCIVRPSGRRYGMILWNVNDKVELEY